MLLYTDREKWGGIVPGDILVFETHPIHPENKAHSRNLTVTPPTPIADNTRLSDKTPFLALLFGRSDNARDLKPEYVAMAMQRVWPELQVDVKSPELAETRRP